MQDNFVQSKHRILSTARAPESSERRILQHVNEGKFHFEENSLPGAYRSDFSEQLNIRFVVRVHKILCSLLTTAQTYAQDS
jgi:hypothetical protein